MPNSKIISVKFNKLFVKALIFMFIGAIIFKLDFLSASKPAAVTAASSNLIKNGSFENDIDNYWEIWHGSESSRQYELYRSYDAPYGYGSYSAAIKANGAAEENWFTGLVSKAASNNFSVESGKTYYLIFFAKGTSNFSASVFLEDSASFAAITEVSSVNITTEWQKMIVSFTPNATSAKAILNYMFGGMPKNSDLFLDGVQLFESNISLLTTEVKGYIGETGKTLRLNNISFFTEKDIEIELPFYDNKTSSITAKKFHPEKIAGNDIYFSLYEQTFADIGAVYVNGILVGRFNYTILPKITDFYPSLIRANEDVTISGSGFNPALDLEKTYAILNTIDIKGVKSDVWVKPHAIDSKLSQITLRLPYGIISGRIYVQTSYRDLKSQDILSQSNYLKYKVKPIIYSLEWSRRGYEQVGDKLTIHGKGLANSPQVIFYDGANNIIARKAAVLKNIFNEEIIEVATPDKINNLNLTVMVDGVESDQEQALVYSARPRLVSLSAKTARKINSTGQVVPAAKVGETITISGQGFTSVESSQVEFQGYNNKISGAVASIDKEGRTIKAVVPAGAQNGFLAVITNGQISNYLPLEIIPSVISITPNPVAPGQDMQIHVSGVGSNEKLTTVYFKLTDREQITVEPISNSVLADGETVINLKAPLAVSSQYSSINVQYENWRDDGTLNLTAQPHISDASVDLDDKILIIRGYGFSVKDSENIVTYKYADKDHTIITPKVSMIGVFPTEEGQEIRVRLLDNYRYGYVVVTVNGQASNEANFGPVQVRKTARRVEYVKSLGKIMGVLYINGYNFGSKGEVIVNGHSAETHYRSEFFIIAVIDQKYVYDNPVVVTKE